MKVALGFAVLAFGGTALAARTGSLPSAVQERAHTIFSDVGVPPPASAAPTQVARGSVPTPTRAPSRTATPTPSQRATLELCRVWDAARQDPPGKGVPPQARRALADAAGGVREIDGFCAALLGTASASATATATTEPAGPGRPTRSGKTPATPSHPGKGPGNGNGKSEGPGR